MKGVKKEKVFYKNKNIHRKKGKERIMEYLKQFLKEEKIKYIKEFFKTGNKELLKKIEDIDRFLYVNEKVKGGI